MWTFVRTASAAAIVLLAADANAASLPSCSNDVGKYCMDDDADFSAEGIRVCLAANSGNLEEGCVTFRALTAACRAELAPGGLCPDPSESMPCLLQRLKPDQLSTKCAEAVALNVATEVDTSLRGTFWADGKRIITDDELSALNEDDTMVYKKWLKRKKKKSGANSDVQYAIKKQKEEKHMKIITLQATTAARKAIESGDDPKTLKRLAYKSVKTACAAVTAEDSKMTFTKDQMKEMAKAAVKAAKQWKDSSEL